MPGQADRAASDRELCRYLAALSVPNRIALLRKLQLPHALGDIALPAVRARGALQPSRALSRTAVQEHLGKLHELGLVEARSVVRDGRRVTEYVVNHARLFVLVEELRDLGLIRASRGGPEGTVAGAATEGEVRLPQGPALVVVGGPLEGAAFALSGAGPWRVGRGEGLEVPLPHDPFVSKENAVVRGKGAARVVEALAGSKNGTRVNWRPLRPGETAALAPGDVLGVGRSLLVFRGGPP